MGMRFASSAGLIFVAVTLSTLLALESPRERRAKSHWSFQRVEHGVLPTASRAWGGSAIDRFVVAKLDGEGLTPSPEASRETLIRRLSLDLAGLQPAPGDVEAFLNDTSPDAYERRVDRLLASPRFGERWARHWLDVAHYADSEGYEGDKYRAMWPYRDWVVDALNGDLPFDRFVTEQVAGDLLPAATLQQQIATAFFRNSLGEGTGGAVRMQLLVERTNTTGATFLALTLGCAQCHSHKLEPISQHEFYQLFAFFNGSQDANAEVAVDERLKKLPEFEKKKIHLVPVLKGVEKPGKTTVYVRGIFENPGDEVTPGVPGVLPDLPAASRADGRVPTRLDLAEWLVSRDNPLTSRVIVNRIWQRYFGLGFVETENDFGTNGARPSHPRLLDWLAVELMENGWSLKRLHRAILTSATYRQSSRLRPDLAERDPQNRLLARASRLRLESEIVRDVALRAGGLLSLKMGGPSVFPVQTEGVMEGRADKTPWIQSQGEEVYRRGLYVHFWRLTPHPFFKLFDVPDGAESCTRRQRNNTPLQALALLNHPWITECTQAFSRRVLEDVTATDDAARIEAAFRLCLGRTPDAEERQILQELLDGQRATAPEGDREIRSWAAVARALYNLDEFITRE